MEPTKTTTGHSAKLNGRNGLVPPFAPGHFRLPYMAALMPNEQNPGSLALLYVSAFRKDKINYTCFMTAYSTRDKPDPFSVQIGSAVKHDLTTGMADDDPNYSSIAWFRTSVKIKALPGETDPSVVSKKCGIMQIFQWYGMLGCRLWAQCLVAGYSYMYLAGQTPMMGQTAVDECVLLACMLVSASSRFNSEVSRNEPVTNSSANNE